MALKVVEARALRTELNTGNAPAIGGVGQSVSLRRHVGGTGNLRPTDRVQRLAQGVKGLHLPGRMRDKRIGQQFRSRKTKLTEQIRKATVKLTGPLDPACVSRLGSEDGITNPSRVALVWFSATTVVPRLLFATLIPIGRQISGQIRHRLRAVEVDHGGNCRRGRP